MSSLDWLVPGLAFAVGVGVATAVWWFYDRWRDRPAAAPPPVSESVHPTERAGVPVVRPAPRPAQPLAPEPGALRTSQRVVLHLARQPRLAYGDVAPPELTQAGMTRGLSVSQPALARVLRRLIDGGAILEMRTHVAGQPQRLKVYQLTVHGEAIARELRSRSAALIQPHSAAPSGRARVYVAEPSEGARIPEP